MFLGSLILVIGTIIQATCHNLGGFMGGRFLLGFGVAIAATAGPAYVSEMAHPAYRGAMTGLYNVLWYGGGIPGTFIPWRTSRIQSDMSWRIPVWLQMVFSGLVMIFCFLLPEVCLTLSPSPFHFILLSKSLTQKQSPRWLISRDRHEEALKVLAEYHGEGDRNSPIVQLELQEMQQEISKTGSDKRWWDYRELFNTREARYRSMMVIFIGMSLFTYHLISIIRNFQSIFMLILWI